MKAIRMMLARPAVRAAIADTRGLTTVEYVIILVLIAILSIGAWSGFGESITKKLGDSSGKIDALGAEAPQGGGG